MNDAVCLPSNRASASFGVAFWALFGLIELSEFEMDAQYTIVKDIALVLFGVFNVLAVLVTLNMLIAILNESFSQQAVSRYVYNASRAKHPTWASKLLKSWIESYARKNYAFTGLTSLY